jgi:hypothetical protein
MTLIIAGAAPDFVVHASDRLVSEKYPSGTTTPYSPNENKTVIFNCRDAIGVIGYTGDAYLKKRSTDEYIAKALAVGKSKKRPKLGAFSARDFEPLGSASLNQIVKRLISLKAEATARRGFFLQICVAGFRLRRHKWLRFLITITIDGDRCSIRPLMRRPMERPAVISWCQIGLKLDENDLLQRVNEGVPDGTTPIADAYRAAMINTIRHQADRVAGVGRDIMTVVIPNPAASRHIYWEFFEDEKIPTEYIYSPIILTRNAVFGPSVGNVFSPFPSGNWTYCCTNKMKQIKTPEDGILWAMSISNQTRKPPR